MKRFLALILSICLLMGFCAAEATTITGDGEGASGETLVSLTIDRSLDSYTVIIPPTVVIDTVTEEGEMDVVLESGYKLISGNKIKVTVSSANGCKLINEDNSNSWVYKLTYYEENMPHWIGSAGQFKIIEVTKTSDATIDHSITLYPKVDGLPTAGVYTDTLTFTVTVE